MTIVLSHKTAALYHNAPYRPVALPSFPEKRQPLKICAPTAEEVWEAREYLVSRGVPPHLLETIDLLVANDAARRDLSGVCCHVSMLDFPPGSLHRIKGGIYVVDVRMCALQAASYMNIYEVVEYYNELCSSIERPFDEDEDYRDVPCRTSRAALRQFIEAMPRACGRKHALHALSYVRDRARSPMEIALLMSLVMPKSLGGLGLREVELDYRVDVSKRARALTRRGCFYFDLFVKTARLDIEYDGVIHEDDGNDAIDNERRNALKIMGYGIVNVTRHAFFDQASFKRVVEAIRRRCSIRPSRMPDGFEEKQEYLRRFVLRRWL